MKFLFGSLLAASSVLAAAIDVTQDDFVAAIRSQWGPVIVMDGLFLTRFPEFPEEPVWRISNSTGTICTVAESLCLTVIPGKRADRGEETIALTKVEHPDQITPYMRWDVMPVYQADGGVAYRILSRVMANPLLALDADREENGGMIMWPFNRSAQQQLFTFPGARPAPVPVAAPAPVIADPLMEELNQATDAMDYQYLFQKAVRQGNLAVLQAVLGHPEVDPNQGGNQSLMEAAVDGRADMVRALLADRRVKSSPDGLNVILGAVRGGNAEVVRLLLEDARFDPAAENNKALKEAERMGADEIVQLLRDDLRVVFAATF